MKTGAHLKIKNFGSRMMGVELLGDPKKPEPEYFKVKFPGGEFYLARCSDGSYWAHIHKHQADSPEVICGDALEGVLLDGRIDVKGMHTPETSCGDLDNPNAYHLAIRIGVRR